MSNVCIVGLQWGDEGKGKIVDVLTDDFDIIVRYQGGSNAGHTVVVNDKKFILHLIPSGILHPGKQCVIGNGVALDPAILLQEIEELKRLGFSMDNNLYISDGAHIVFPHHKQLDLLLENEKGNNKIGTTGRGIGPCYTDKMARNGIRVAELYHPEYFKGRLKNIVEEKNKILVNIFQAPPLSWEQTYNEYLIYAEKMKPMVCDTVEFINEAVKGSKNILFEGAQGSLLDVDFGTYPFITSSNATACGVSSGVGISPKQIHRVLGVMKAYTTRVGSGPFPTEINGELGEHIRQKGGEFGATTGRPRRCGWFDAVAVKHSITISGVDSVILTKFDVLDDQKTIKVCVGYKFGQKTYTRFPTDLAALPHCEPIYEELPGWLKDTTKMRSSKALPVNAKNYIRTIESIIGLKIEMVSVGPERSQIIRVS
ncbi:MAG TPA: adenylosuccinate synthase [Candidatus Brocadiia bacterium]|nr:adenylosuccinate synthase [Planctomycetota bacterium]MBI4008277.1 adenylosuccinate synthase [Planctomycetota bacterium]MDO8095001.1 adenylosuccinate synthase [Candidatus Brocadiales bacterium]